MSAATVRSRDHADNTSLYAFALVAGALTTAGLCVLAVTHPLLTLFVVLAGTALLVCLWRIEVALLLLVAAGPLEAAYQPTGGLTLSKIAGVVAFVSFALHALNSRRRLRFDGMHVLVLVLLALSLISTANAHDQSSATTTVIRYASFVALFFVISQFGDAERLLRYIAWALTLAATGASYLALENLFSGNSLLAGLPYANENDVAFTLATALPLAIWLLRERGYRRVLVVACVATIAAAIVLTFSRGAFVGLGAAVLWKVVAERRQLGLVTFGAFAAVVTVFVLSSLNSNQVHKATLAKQKTAQENVVTRLAAWSAAARLATDHPVVGVGPGNFGAYFFQATGRPSGTLHLTQAHNTYLDVAAELGVGGFVVFVSFVVLALSRAVVAAKESVGPPGLASALATALVVAAFSGSFISAQYSAPFWLLGALTAAVWSQRRAPRSAAS